MNKRFDILVSHLCSEIDNLNEDLQEMAVSRDYWKEKYSNLVNENLENAGKMTGSLLVLALDGHLK